MYAILLIYRPEVPLLAHVAVEEYDDTFSTLKGYLIAPPLKVATNDSDSYYGHSDSDSGSGSSYDDSGSGNDNDSYGDSYGDHSETAYLILFY